MDLRVALLVPEDLHFCCLCRDGTSVPSCQIMLHRTLQDHPAPSLSRCCQARVRAHPFKCKSSGKAWLSPVEDQGFPELSSK